MQKQGLIFISLQVQAQNLFIKALTLRSNVAPRLMGFPKINTSPKAPLKNPKRKNLLTYKIRTVHIYVLENMSKAGNNKVINNLKDSCRTVASH